MEGALQICTTHFSPWIRSVLDLLNFTSKKDWSLSNRAGLNGESWKGAVCKLDWDVLFLQTLRCFWSLNSIEMFWWFNASWLPMPQMFTLFSRKIQVMTLISFLRREEACASAKDSSLVVSVGFFGEKKTKNMSFMVKTGWNGLISTHSQEVFSNCPAKNRALRNRSGHGNIGSIACFDAMGFRARLG